MIKNKMNHRMHKRPLAMVCLFLVAVAALYYFGTGAEPAFPDTAAWEKREIIVSGRVCRKEKQNFYLELDVNSIKLNLDSAGFRNVFQNGFQDDFQNDLQGAGASQPVSAAGVTGKQPKIICAYPEGKTDSKGNAYSEGKTDSKGNAYSEGKAYSEGNAYTGEKGDSEASPYAEELKIGSEITIQGTWRNYNAASNFGEFDAKGYYDKLNIVGRISDVTLLAKGERFSCLGEALYTLRCYFEKRLYRIFPQKEAGILCMMLLGDKQEADKDIKELYRRNGIVHILSISGLHITLIGMGLYRLLRRLGMPVAPAAVGGSIVLLLYGGMTGMSISACRAIGMYCLRMLSFVCGRTYDLLTSLWVLAMVMVLQNPSNLGQAGFLLSFLAVLGMGMVYPVLEQTVRGKFWGREVFLAGSSVTLMTLPVQLWFYYEVPVWSVGLNMLVLPCVSVLVAVGFVVMLVPGTGILGTVDCLLFAGMEGACRLFERLPFHTWNPGRPEIWQIVLYYAGILLFLLLGKLWENETVREAQESGGIRKVEQTGTGGGMKESRSIQKAEQAGTGGGTKESRSIQKAEQTGTGRGIREKGRIRDVLLKRPGRRYVRSGVQVCLLVFLVWLLGRSSVRGDRVTFLDVGQGDCACLKLASGETFLFDCGSVSRSKVGESVLLPFLKYYGIHHLDAVFVSHADKDHSKGVEELLLLAEEENIVIDQLVLPGGKETEELQTEFETVLKAAEKYREWKPLALQKMQAGDNWACGTWKFYTLNPPVHREGLESNAASLCFYAESAAFRILFTGDVEGKGEEALLKELERLGKEPVTVLKVAHHGSRNSTSKQFLERVKPKLAVLSCGAENSYGHPHAELLERLETAGSYILRTDYNGAITVRLDGDKVEAESYLKK